MSRSWSGWKKGNPVTPASINVSGHEELHRLVIGFGLGLPTRHSIFREIEDMRITSLAILVIGLGGLWLAGATVGVAESDQIVQAKKCTYGTYIDSSGKRRCRKRPRGSFSG